MKETFADRVIRFYTEMDRYWLLPDGFDLIDPFCSGDTIEVFSQFYQKYFSDNRERVMLLGINPGRHGAGVTGVPFTDPVIIADQCGIDNGFDRRQELSAIYVYEFIDAYSGIEKFYADFYINSICPLGFLKDGKNANYYDDKALYQAVKPHIVTGIKQQVEMGCRTDVAVSLGKGQNFKYLKMLNDEYHFFDKTYAVPHPRWVMQYRRKSKQDHIDHTVRLLQEVL